MPHLHVFDAEVWIWFHSATVLTCLCSKLLLGRRRWTHQSQSPQTTAAAAHCWQAGQSAHLQPRAPLLHWHCRRPDQLLLFNKKKKVFTCFSQPTWRDMQMSQRGPWRNQSQELNLLSSGEAVHAASVGIAAAECCGARPFACLPCSFYGGPCRTSHCECSTSDILGGGYMHQAGSLQTVCSLK